MPTVNKLIAQGRGLAAALLKRAAGVELDWSVRSKSRFDATDSAGRRLEVSLPPGTVLRGGDVLVADDGSLVVVKAAVQSVLVVRHCSHHGAPGDLLKAAYHLGSRHAAVELQPDHLKIEPDRTLAQQLEGMHLVVSEETAPFEPEGGAGHHGHDHDHGHDHAHGHHDHGHDHNRTHAHDGGHDRCGHDHGPGGHGHHHR